MRKISEMRLVEILRGVNFPTFVGMTTNTELDLYKKGNPYVGVRKTSKKYKIITGFDYQNSIFNRLKKEGKDPIDTNPTDRPVWFRMISKGLVTDEKTGTKFYLRYQYQKDSTTESTYTFEGNPIEKRLFESWEKNRDDHYKNQGLDNPLLFQVCKIENIDQFSIFGEQYEIIHDWVGVMEEVLEEVEV